MEEEACHRSKWTLKYVLVFDHFVPLPFNIYWLFLPFWLLTYIKRIWILRIPSAEWASRINRNRQLLLSVPPSLLNNAHLLRQLASLPRQRQHLPPPCRLSSCLKSQSWGRTNFAGKASALGLLLSKRILDLTSTLKTGWGNNDNYGGDDYHDIDKISARREMSRWKGQGCNDLRNLSLWTSMGSC